jgi:predicted NACHT family NTPase
LDKEYKEIKAKVEQTRTQIQSEKQKGQQLRGQVEDKRDLVNGVRQSYEGALVERVASYSESNNQNYDQPSFGA